MSKPVTYRFPMQSGVTLSIFDNLSFTSSPQKLVIEGRLTGRGSVDGFIPDLADCDVEIIVKATPRFKPGYYRRKGERWKDKDLYHYNTPPWTLPGYPYFRNPDDWERVEVTATHAV